MFHYCSGNILAGELAIGQEGVIPVEDGERSDLDR